MEFIELLRPFLGQGMVSGAALFLLLYYRRSEKELRDELRSEIERVRADRDEAYATISKMRDTKNRLREENESLQTEIANRTEISKRYPEGGGHS